MSERETSDRYMTFSGLHFNRGYTIEVTVSDLAGNTTKESITAGTKGVDSAKNGNIIFSAPSWSEGKASVTITKKDGMYLNMVYRVYDENMRIIKHYTEIKSGETITGLNHKDTIEACFKDASSYEERLW